ncbi:MAG TPA: trigger factor [Solimonas sp.]|nr:trigger factor [Solimonas sp.]
MEVKVEPGAGLQRAMHVVVPAERVSKAVDERLKRIAGRAKLPGFRPGKAPYKVIQQQFGDSARVEAISDLVNQTYPEALSKAGVNPAGAPKIDITAERAGQALEYVASFEIYPEVKLNSLARIKIEKPSVEVGEADVDKLIGNLLKARRTLEPVTRPATGGDVVTVDFEGRIDGEPFPGSQGKDVTIELGQSQFLPDLEKGIEGHSANDSFSVDVDFPPDYRAEQLRGKRAQFSVTLKEVKEPNLPPVNAEFLKVHNVPEGEGEAGLRAKCRAALDKEAAKGTTDRLKAQALDQLLSANPIDIPRALIEQEVPRLREEAAARMNMGKLKPERLQQMLPAAIFEPQAHRRVALGLLIGEVIKARDIKLDHGRVERMLGDIAADYEHPEQVIAFYRGRPDLMQGLRAMVLEEQVVESLIAGAETSEKKMTLDELLNPAKTAQA